ncbi:MAG: tyrosine-protein phosphatase [Oscillospiraceae bacterium]|nr:tyrosine-protein phosphatase [Oscillospiraceae bacterium]MDD3832419.1 tyrosine-protein phosphatase [Oscillospiraceae bacterium]MDD4546764.1 tyrosine-protein phosphatase [Oscillospiraceae bacterium]
MIEKVNKPIKLDGAHNVRELGGYTTSDGRTTKNGVFLRGDGTHALTDQDLRILLEAGIYLVIDMRSPDEVEQFPSRFYMADNNIRYENIVMFDGLQSLFAGEEIQNSMAGLYCRLLDDCREQYSRIFRLFIDNDRASLFHCTAGKDRTGVVAMLLLNLAGVPNELIVADYSVSEHNMSDLFERQHKQLENMGVVVPEYVFGSPAEDMEITLDYLETKYGGANEYLKLCGLTQYEVDILKARLVE